ncbi:MAG: threonine synthase [Pyramidobacter sp.]
MWRYEGAYPLRYEDLTVTFDEGFTPLVRVPSQKCRLRVKMDQLMPTGSFKDRGTVMVVNYLMRRGATMITEDSSGNAGASVAGYCALAGIPCEIYVPKGNSSGKLTQIRAYGARIFEIEGSRSDVASMAQKKSQSYAGHNWHPMFIQGTKSLAYELWEQNGFRAPETIVAAAGNGSAILGCYYGFKELMKNGEIDRMPRCFAVQAANCDPIYRQYMGLEPRKHYRRTIAEGIALTEPNKADQVVRAARETGGAVLCVSEEEILEAMVLLARRGIYAEPTSCVAYAGICRLCGEQALGREDDVVMLVSGNGLKAGAEIESLLKNRQGERK